MVKKCLELRLFPDEQGKSWGKSCQDIQRELLVNLPYTVTVVKVVIPPLVNGYPP